MDDAAGIRFIEVERLRRREAELLEANDREIERRREAEAGLELALGALETVIASRDRHTREREIYKTSDGLPYGHWSPATALVDSGALAAARHVVQKLRNGQA